MGVAPVEPPANRIPFPTGLERLRAKGTAILVLILLLPLLQGCAKVPPGVTGAGLRRLSVEMRVRGSINLNNYYFFAFNAAEGAPIGPVPVVSPPWGNGWSAGSMTHFVRINASEPSFYGVYRVDDPQTLLTASYVGRPIEYIDPRGGNILRFVLDLDLLFPPDKPQPQQITFNFIATDIVVTDPNWRGRKLVDGLGPTGTTFVTIPLQHGRIFRNEDASVPEEAGDVPDPDLDIVDWKIEVSLR
jgi:hypothetical protein